MVPSIGVMPRDGNLALAFFGRIRKVQPRMLSGSLSAGRRSFASKRIVVLVILLDNTNCVQAKQQLFALDERALVAVRSGGQIDVPLAPTISGMESSERGVARCVRGGWLCPDLRSIFSYRSAIMRQ